MLASMMFGAAAMMAGSIAGSAEVSKGNLDNGKKIFTEGKGDVPACTSCHGENGMGNDMMGTPRLAGQIVVFLLKQLEDFATDKRMDTTMYVMNTNAKGLSAQDRVDVATYINKMADGTALSNLDELKANGTSVGQPYLGKIIVNYGIEEKGVPGCKSCHGFNGRGVDPIYPKLNKQKYVYLVNQLKKWRDGTRTNDPMGQMQHVARNLSDADINNAASYLAGAADTTLGNSRTPEQHMPLAYDPRE
jgi:cytochrome c553